MRTRTESAATARRGVKALVCTLPVVIAILLACGCVEVKDTLTIKADGSGTVRIETVVHQSALITQMGYRGMMMGDVGALMYPPSDVQTARTFFPGDGFEVKVKRNRQSPGTTGVIVEVEFKDVNALIGSPYGQAHSLRLERDGDELVLTARSGMEHLAHGEQFLKADHEDGMGEMLKDAGKEYDKLAFEFTIELPGEAAVEGDVATAAGNTVTWAVDLSEAEDRAKAVERLDAVVTARCRAKELAFTPQPVTRLDLCAFDKLADGKLADAPAVDTEKIKAQARFVPVALRVARSFDLAGTGNYYGEANGTTLHGVIVVPRELEPERWGETKLTQATDDQGDDLLPDEEGDDNMMRWTSRSRMTVSSAASDEDNEKDPNTTYHFQASFEPPGFDAKAIASIKGTIAMHYAGAQHLVRIKDAVTGEAITDTTIEESGIYGYGGEDEGTPLKSEALAGLGLEITLVAASRMPGLIMLRFSWDAEHGSIERIQIFDADGRPWRTATLGDMYGGFSYPRAQAALAAVVVGAPKAPLSLAIEVRTAGPSVAVPFELKDVPLTPRAPSVKPTDDEEHDDAE